jgi:hypothetical protein
MLKSKVSTRMSLAMIRKDLETILRVSRDRKKRQKLVYSNVRENYHHDKRNERQVPFRRR